MILNLFIKSFANTFFDIAFTFFDSLPSKSVFSTKLARSFMFTKFACANLALEFFSVYLSNS